jgi:hypothetical protein
MQTDNIRIVPWIPTVRFTTLMLMLACSAIGIVIGSLTTEKIVVKQDSLTKAAEPAAPGTSSAKESAGASREPENRASNARQEAHDTQKPPAALPSSATEGGGASRDPGNRPSRASNARQEASDTATPPATLQNPDYQIRHKREPRPARMIRGRQLDRPLPDEGGERVEGRHSARDYRDLRNQMLNR